MALVTMDRLLAMCTSNWFDDDGNVVAPAVATQLASGVVQVVMGEKACAARRSDGSVVTWGCPSSGGDSSAVAPQLASGVVEVVMGGSAGAARG